MKGQQWLVFESSQPTKVWVSSAFPLSSKRLGKRRTRISLNQENKERYSQFQPINFHEATRSRKEQRENKTPSNFILLPAFLQCDGTPETLISLLIGILNTALQC